VDGGWLDFGYSVKTTAMQGICNKEHWHGPESNYFPIFPTLSAKWQSSNASEL
jgi:hypothetical protein